jgi:hypothetical protein
MKPSHLFLLLFACLLGLIHAVYLDDRKTPVAEAADSGENQARPVAENTRPEEIPVAEPLPETVAVAQPAGAKPVAREVQAPKDWVKRTISELWTDGPQKLAGRQRVRIVEAEFKYLRL